jgi:hypothetical protein
MRPILLRRPPQNFEVSVSTGNMEPRGFESDFRSARGHVATIKSGGGVATKADWIGCQARDY